MGRCTGVQAAVSGGGSGPRTQLLLGAVLPEHRVASRRGRAELAPLLGLPLSVCLPPADRSPDHGRRGRPPGRTPFTAGGRHAHRRVWWLPLSTPSSVLSLAGGRARRRPRGRARRPNGPPAPRSRGRRNTSADALRRGAWSLRPPGCGRREPFAARPSPVRSVPGSRAGRLLGVSPGRSRSSCRCR